MGKMDNTILSVRNDIFGDCVKKEKDVGDELLSLNVDVGKQILDYEFVFIENDKCEISNNTPIIVNDQSSEITNCEEVSEMPAFFIEVPQVVAEETVEYTDLSNIIVDSNVLVKSHQKEFYTHENIINNLLSVSKPPETSSKNQFLIKNGNNTQPLLIVKSERLREQCTNNEDDKPEANPVKLDQKTPKIESQRKCSKLSKIKQPEKKALPDNNCMDNSKNSDLMWLLNFKLDDIGSVPFHPLDETDSDAKPNDAKDRKDSQKEKRKEQSEDSPSTEENASYSSRKKPPFTYTELIQCALQEKGPLTVSEIYRWISETFPYYKSWDDRWKNSVRHNLSINPYFRKGTKARQGSGHLWTVSKSADSTKNCSWKRQRYQEFEEYTKRTRLEEVAVDDAREAAMAAASIEDKENQGVHRDVLLATQHSISCMEASLEQSAEEILSGVKRNVAVEYIEPPKLGGDGKNDFLNPVSKEDLMGECGFFNQIELNLTAEAADHLGITDTDQVFELPEDFGFQYADASVQGHQLLSLVN